MSATFEIPGAESMRLSGQGVTLHVIAAGPAKGRLVVLLHGFPEFWYGWRRQIEPLAAAGFRVLAPDQRGYNLSDKPAAIGAYALALLAGDVLRAADAMGRERFAVVGHDWGGLVAWHLAAHHPERIERAAVLNAPNPQTAGSYLLSHPRQMARSWYALMFQIPVLPEWAMRAGDFAWLRRALAGSSRPGTFGEEEFRRYRDAWAQPGALTAMVNWYRALPRHRPSDGSLRIEVPLRVIWGDRDRFLEQGLAEAGLRSCDRGHAVHLPEATHWLHHEEPAKVNRLLLEFLR